MSPRRKCWKIIYHFPHTYFDEQLHDFLELVADQTNVVLSYHLRVPTSHIIGDNYCRKKTSCS